MAPHLSSGAHDRATSPFPAYSPYANFHLPSPSESSDSDDDETLPFPAALQRNDFLAPDFEPTAYLSSLFPSEDGAISAQRHQTLEDLRTELRERSSAISAELLELVNANYTSFLSLGDELRGGDERVEDVRVALFGFRRSIEDIHGRVKERRLAVSDASRELGAVQSAIGVGRALLEVDDRLFLLEDRLDLASGAGKDGMAGMDTAVWSTSETEDEDEDDDEDDAPGQGAVFFGGSSPTKLAALARDLILATQSARALDPSIPFVKAAHERLAKCRETLMLDLNAALKDAQKHSRSDVGQARILRILAVYRVLDGEEEAVRILREK